ncbi:MAG: 3-deoxy-manno-octulosonate cytidylyltransferase [Candidatus Omnitrophica bacterium]|nr:3-deoxy-manno-octulosonate cytidylyltransferase [Candidatus Omnitrophota bacterium]
MVLGVIPARYGSTRFPGKVLAAVAGRAMVERVWTQAKCAKRLTRLLVATEDRRVAEAVKAFGGEAVMTDPGCASGSDRVWQAAKDLPAAIIVNIQSDEPLLAPEMVDRMVEALKASPEADLATLAFRMEDSRGYENPNVVKVVTDPRGFALYFSRSPIPFYRGGKGPKLWYKHLGLYAYRKEALRRFVNLAPSVLEQAEGLEQLRALENGFKIRVAESPADTVAVDTPEDLKRVEEILSHA